MATRNSPIPPVLAALAGGRDYIPTREFAQAVSKSEHTIRVHHHLKGHAFGIRPTKIGGLLLWPVAAIAEILTGTSPTEPGTREAGKDRRPRLKLPKKAAASAAVELTTSAAKTEGVTTQAGKGRPSRQKPRKKRAASTAAEVTT